MEEAGYIETAWSAASGAFLLFSGLARPTEEGFFPVPIFCAGCDFSTDNFLSSEIFYKLPSYYKRFTWT